MDAPRRNKTCAMISIILMVWTVIMLIGPVAYQRSIVLPYARVQSYNFTITMSSNASDTAQVRVERVYSRYLASAHKNLMVRIYRTLIPYEIHDYSYANHYFVYTDMNSDDCT